MALINISIIQNKPQLHPQIVSWNQLQTLHNTVKPVVLGERQPFFFHPPVSILTPVNLVCVRRSAKDYEMRCWEISVLISRWSEIPQDNVTVCGFTNGRRLSAYLPNSSRRPSTYREKHAAEQTSLPPTPPGSLKITKPVSRGDDYLQLMKLWTVWARGSVMERARWAEEEGQGVVRPSNWL